MATSSNQLAVVDTNVLVYALFEEAEQFEASSLLLLHAKQDQHGLCVTPQVMAELYAVITAPKRVSAPFTPAEAITTIRTLSASLVMLPIPPDVTERWMTLVKQQPVIGANIFDVRVLTRLLRICTLRIKPLAANTLRRAVFRGKSCSNGRRCEAGSITSQNG